MIFLLSTFPALVNPMIWLEAEVRAQLDHTIDGLRRALKSAIRLEFATIPPYLYALYSLKPGKNKEIAGIISSVVLEEMLHMALACNVLNAIGDSPTIDSPGFLVNYPDRLPGAVEGFLHVSLAAFSMDVLVHTFMVIEQPEKIREFPIFPASQLYEPDAFDLDGRPITVGDFYRAIIEEIEAQGPAIFTGDPTHQLTTSFTNIHLFPVTGLASAVRALRLIIDQGEGTKTSPFLDKEPAHFYRFAQILKGRTLIRNPHMEPGEPSFIYGGPQVPLNAADVWPVLRDPKAQLYLPGSPADLANRDFNRTFTRMLKELDAAFNGKPDRIAIAITEMRNMSRQAQYLMSLPVDWRNAGPSFEYDASAYCAQG